MAMLPVLPWQHCPRIALGPARPSLAVESVRTAPAVHARAIGRIAEQRSRATQRSAERAHQRA